MECKMVLIGSIVFYRTTNLVYCTPGKLKIRLTNYRNTKKLSNKLMKTLGLTKLKY
jgi:hypothetical protein